jgi:hypothetical protein
MKTSKENNKEKKKEKEEEQGMTTADLYKFVIEEVINNMRGEFEAEGALGALDELKQVSLYQV